MAAPSYDGAPDVGDVGQVVRDCKDSQKAAGAPSFARILGDEMIARANDSILAGRALSESSSPGHPRRAGALVISMYTRCAADGAVRPFLRPRLRAAGTEYRLPFSLASRLPRGPLSAWPREFTNTHSSSPCAAERLNSNQPVARVAILHHGHRYSIVFYSRLVVATTNQLDHCPQLACALRFFVRIASHL